MGFVINDPAVKRDGLHDASVQVSSDCSDWSAQTARQTPQLHILLTYSISPYTPTLH